MKKRRKFRLRHLLLLILVFVVSKTLITQRSMMKTLNEKKLLEEQNVKELEISIEKLNSEIADKDSLEFIEKVAREDFKMVRPREIIYIDENKNKNHFINIKKD